MGESILGTLVVLFLAIVLIGMFGAVLRFMLAVFASLIASPFRLLYFLIGLFTGGILFDDEDSCIDCDYDEL